MPRLRRHMGSRGTSWPSSTVVPMCGRRCPVPVAVSVAVSAAATLWEWLRVVIELGGRSRSRSRHRLACSWVRAPPAASIGSMFIVTRYIVKQLVKVKRRMCSVCREGPGKRGWSRRAGGEPERMRANGGGRSRAPQGRSRLGVPAARAVTNSVLSAHAVQKVCMQIT